MTIPEFEIAEVDDLGKIKVLLEHQHKRKKIIHKLRSLAKEKNRNLDNHPEIINETYKFEWYIATDEPSLVDSLYYLYFWILLKGRYLILDVDKKSIKKKKQQVQLDEQSPIKHNSQTRFEKDILRATESVGDLKEKFNRMIQDNGSQEDLLNSTINARMNNLGVSPMKNSLSAFVTPNSSPVPSPRKSSFGNISPAPSPKKSNSDITFQKKFVLMDSPYIKNVLKFKYDMAEYLAIVVEEYELDEMKLPLSYFLNDFPTSKVVLDSESEQMNKDFVSRIPGYELILFVASLDVSACSEQIKFIHSLIKRHLESGLVWDLHKIHQDSGTLTSDITLKPDHSKYLEFGKCLLNFIFEIYPSPIEREKLLRNFNANPKQYNKIRDLKSSYAISKFKNFWQEWNELDFILLNNFIVKNDLDLDTEMNSKRKKLASGEAIEYKAWENNSIVTKTYQLGI